MSLVSMGLRTALSTERVVSSENADVVVVSGLALGTGASTGTGVIATGLPLSTTTKGDVTANYLERMAAWIPSESIAAFVGLAGAFTIFDALWKELFVVVVIGGLTPFLAYVSVQASAKRRNKESEVRRKAPQTAALALLAYVLWWIATPGSAPTADWGVHPLITTTVLMLGVFLIPHLAKRLKIDPSGITTTAP